MCVLAHPDDESLGTGGILARYAAEGIETYLVTATRGERGWQGDPADDPGLHELGRIHEGELRCAAENLGVREVTFLDYADGDLDQADPMEATGRIVAQLRRVRPHVVITFGPDGVYGHPDHIAICQFTTAAIVCAADASYQPDGLPPHRVSKLYYIAETRDLIAAYESVFGDIVMPVDGVERRANGWQAWALTTQIVTEAHWSTVWRAVGCHHSQLPEYGKLEQLAPEQHQVLWGRRTFYRAFSLVNGGRKIEQDLFEGLRSQIEREV
jgi:LmbE family N-acetylglucosaminyl deacetylase